jgi:Mg2+/Co2+ transporter CorB
MIILSGFFSSSETGMMALNRYRLRHLVKIKHRAAIKTDVLLGRPDRLIGLILLGNNLVNFVAASIATIIGIRLLGDIGPAVATVITVVMFLIFAEVMPKTVAALYPEKIAFPAAYILTPLMKILYPGVWLINRVANTLLRLLGFQASEKTDEPLTQEELHTIVREAGSLIPRRHQRMLISILELEKVAVDDIMVPRNEMVAIDINDTANEITDLLYHCQHNRIPVFEGDIDNVIGMLHVRQISRILNDMDEFSPEDLKKIITEPYYIPEGTQLHTQLRNFQRNKKRIGLVVDEYGVIQGLVTFDDILEEIVGEFTTDMQDFNLDIREQEDGAYLVDGTATIREINRQLKWNLPLTGPKTLNGLILEQLEQIPETGTSLRVSKYTIEITQVTDNAVKMAKITAPKKISQE